MARLIITEKPSVAETIASALGVSNREDGYFEGNGYIISWCFGHLIELATPDQYDEKYKKWSVDTLPILPDFWKYRVKKDTAKQFKLLKELMNRSDVSEIISGTDAGREGQLIYQLVYNEARCKKPSKRLWISSMEESAIREGIRNMKDNEDYDDLYRSALCRQRADWLVGLNGTRLFTSIYSGKVLKVGRVQTPTLAMIVSRDAEIRNFKKTPYYEVKAVFDGFSATGEKTEDKNAAEEQAKATRGKTAVVTEHVSEEKTVNPPKLFDLTTLQREANRLFGFTAKETLEYTQSLYEKKLVTYPRTDSQYLSDDMGDTAKAVIEKIAGECAFVKQAVSSSSESKADIRENTGRLKPLLNSSKVSDHHAIIPTVQVSASRISDLSKNEEKVLYLIASRLLAATGAVHKYQVTKAVLTVGDYEYSVSGKEINDEGWKIFEDMLKKHFGLGKKVDKKPGNSGKSKSNGKDDSQDDDDSKQRLPEMSEGDEFKVIDAEALEKFTKPPAHYTEAGILSAMEKAGAEGTTDEAERKGLGTPATRADILEKLVKDGFVKREKKQLIATDDGITLIGILPEEVKSAKLTADWENALTLIAKGEYSDEDFMDGIADMVTNLVETYKDTGDSNGTTAFPAAEPLGECPKCGSDVVMGKYGAYCTGKCGMNLARAFGKKLSEKQVKRLLVGKRILLRDIKSKKGTTYDAYLTPEGVEKNSYTAKDGSEVDGFQYKFKMTFADQEED